MKDMLAQFKDFCKEAAECERIAKVATSTRSLKRKKGATTQPRHDYIFASTLCQPSHNQGNGGGSDFVIVIYGM
jgi:hypothetical protein